MIGCWKNKLEKNSEESHLQGRLHTDEVYHYAQMGQTECYCWGEVFPPAANPAHEMLEKYLQQGLKAFSQIDGHYLVVLACADKILLIRDHHGAGSQLYYTDQHFATSLSLLQQTEPSGWQPDDEQLARFLSIGYIAPEHSSFRSVKKLGAGCALTYHQNGLKVESLFPTDGIEPVHRLADLEEASQQYGQLHREAIERRIAGAEHVGLLLSGGYDSGCNLAALRQIYSGKISTFSIGFKGDNWSELPLTRIMSKTYDTNHHEYEIDGSEILSLPEIVRALGDPFVEGGLMVNYCAMRMIGVEKPSVILGGDGSDQYFGTSGREVALHYLMAKSGLMPLIKGIHGLLSHTCFEKDTKSYRIRFHLDKIIHILQGDLFGLPPFLLNTMLQQNNAMPAITSIQPDLRSFEHLYTQHAYESDLNRIINQVILFKASKMAELFDNHLVYPYMDLHLYEFLKTLPVSLKCHGKDALSIARGQMTAKYLLKYHYKPLLPEAITSKKKQGGFAPMPLFFQNELLRQRCADFILNSGVCRAFLRREGVESFLKRYDQEAGQQDGWFWYKQNKAIQFFNLLSLAIWWEEFVEGKRVEL